MSSLLLHEKQYIYYLYTPAWNFSKSFSTSTTILQITYITNGNDNYGHDR